MDVMFCEDTISDEIDFKIKSEKLKVFIERLDNKKEKEIIIKRYGLDNRKPMTQREIAKKLGISRSYVSRIEKRVINKLRKMFEQ